MGIGALRNRLCECGSGLKRKVCHGDSDTGFRSGKTVVGLRSQIPHVPLTGRRCARAAASLLAEIRALNVTLPTSSHLATLLRRLEALGQQCPGRLADGALTPEEAGVARYIDQAERLELTLATLRKRGLLRAGDARLRGLRKGLDRLRSLTLPAQDHLAELELCAWLARGGLDVAFEEPDIVVSGIRGLDRLGVAVKRPRSIKATRGLFRSATEQARRAGIPTIVAMCLDAALHTQTRDGISEAHTSTEQALNSLLERRFEATVKASRVGLDTDSFVVGVLWIGLSTGWIASRGPLSAGYARRFYGEFDLNLDNWSSLAGIGQALMVPLRRGMP